MTKDNGQTPQPDNGPKDSEGLAEWRQNAGDRLFPKFNQEIEQASGVAGLNYGITVNALLEAIFENPMANDETLLEAARTNVGMGSNSPGR